MILNRSVFQSYAKVDVIIANVDAVDTQINLYLAFPFLYFTGFYTPVQFLRIGGFPTAVIPFAVVVLLLSAILIGGCYLAVTHIAFFIIPLSTFLRLSRMMLLSISPS